MRKAFPPHGVVMQIRIPYIYLTGIWSETCHPVKVKRCLLTENTVADHYTNVNEYNIHTRWYEGSDQVTPLQTHSVIYAYLLRQNGVLT